MLQLNAVQRRRLHRALAYAKVPEICASFKRGEALAEADDLSGAIAEFRQALRFDPAALAPSPPSRNTPSMPSAAVVELRPESAVPLVNGSRVEDQVCLQLMAVGKSIRQV